MREIERCSENPWVASGRVRCRDDRIILLAQVGPGVAASGIDGTSAGVGGSVVLLLMLRLPRVAGVGNMSASRKKGALLGGEAAAASCCLGASEGENAAERR